MIDVSTACFFFCNPCAHAELLLHKDALKLFGHKWDFEIIITTISDSVTHHGFILFKEDL